MGKEWCVPLQKLRTGKDPFNLVRHRLGFGCSTAAEYTPCDREVMGLNPAGCCTFLSSLASKQLKVVQHCLILLFFHA